MSSVRMSKQDIKFKMILLCLKPLIVFPIISSEAPWNFIAWIYKNLNSKCTPQHWQLDAVIKLWKLSFAPQNTKENPTTPNNAKDQQFIS